MSPGLIEFTDEDEMVQDMIDDFYRYNLAIKDKVKEPKREYKKEVYKII